MNRFLGILLLAVGLVGCQKVPAGHVGIKVYLLGGEKGIDHEELGVGRYWIGVNEELFLFPTFKQNYVWTKDATEGSPNDESLTFQTTEGLSVNADVGITYSIDPTKVSIVFQTYRRGVEEITDTFLRNMVRDAFNSVSSRMPVESVYGAGKKELVDAVFKEVSTQTAPLGIIVEKIYLIGNLRLPEQVTKAINSKIEATQKAQQRENELREAEAEAKKKVAAAEGEANSILTKAEAQAKANRILAQSLTSELIEYEKATRWNGQLPQVTGGATPFLQMK